MHTTELLWIVPKWPLPANDGARVATRNLLRPLAHAGVRIHLCALVPEGEDVDEEEARRDLGVVSTRVVRRASASPVRHARNALLRPTTPITFAPYSAPGVVRGVRRWIDAHPDTPIVFDGLHAASWTLDDDAAAHLPATYYRAHNVERDLWLRGAADTWNPAMKVLLEVQGRLVERFERRVMSRARAVFPVSDVDRAEFERWTTGTRLVTLPIGFPTPSQPPAPPPDRPALLFVGRLDWPPNKSGLKWLLDEVWAPAKRRNPDLSLDIVGSGNGDWLQAYRGLDGVQLHGRVPEILPWYERCAAAIVPVFFGSGTRVKAIESSMLGRVCISTALGVEGLDLQPNRHYVRAETRAEWIDALARLRPDEARTLGEQAREHVRVRFDPERIAHTLVATVERLGSAD
ncbi:MAG: glycosyltransferase family 4 protein [Myxococcota bacterium]